MKRNTIQRQVILDAIAQLGSHPTAEEVYLHVVKMHPNISKATVYRNLATAAESGEILPVGVINGAMHFDHNNHEHFHFVCESCKKLFDVPTFDIRQFLNLDELNIEKVDLTLRGTCKTCK